MLFVFFELLLEEERNLSSNFMPKGEIVYVLALTEASCSCKSVIELVERYLWQRTFRRVRVL